MKVPNEAKRRLSLTGGRIRTYRAHGSRYQVAPGCRAVTKLSKHVLAQTGLSALHHRDPEPGSTRHILRGWVTLALAGATTLLVGLYVRVPRDGRGSPHGYSVHYDPDMGHGRGQQEPRARARPP